MIDHTEGGKYRMLTEGEIIQGSDEFRMNNGKWRKTFAAGESVTDDDVGDYRRPVTQEIVAGPDDVTGGEFTHNIVQQITFASRDAAVDALVRRVFGAEPVYTDEPLTVANEPDLGEWLGEHAVSVLESHACGVPEGLPPLPPVPEGYDRWEYRGMGWKSAEETIYAFKSARYDMWCEREGSAEGHDDSHYIEAIKDLAPPPPPPPARDPVEIVGTIDAHGCFSITLGSASECDAKYPSCAPHRDVVLVEKLP